MSQPKRVLIIGAGVGGCATAARLALAGLEVTVLEKNEFTGGRCSLIYHGEHRFDRGPSLLLLPPLFHQTFTDLHTTLEAEGVELRKCELNYAVHFGDGERVSMGSDLGGMKLEIERFEGEGGFYRYLGFLREAHKHYELSVKHVLNLDFPSLLSMFRPAFLRHIFELHPFESVYARACRYFTTERMRRLFTFASMYMGMSPFEAPGIYSLLQYTELAQGIWYPIGGFHKIVSALIGIAERHGAVFRLSTPVERILLSADGRRAVGVRTAAGEELFADVLVVNADLVWAYEHLLPPTAYSASLGKRNASCSSLSFYWSLSQKAPQLQTHNVFLANDFQQSFDSIFKHNSLPREPSFYIHVPSRLDPSAAPEGGDSVVVLVPTGHLKPHPHPQVGLGKGLLDLARGEWDEPETVGEQVERARREVITRLERAGMEGFGEWITHEEVATPLTWKQTFNLDKGAILGLAHDFLNVLSFRPRIKHPTIQGCYFVGASTHPGTGVPIILAGARLTATNVLRDLGLGVPRAEGEGQGEGKGKTKPKKEKELDMRLKLKRDWDTLSLLQLLFFLFLTWTLSRHLSTLDQLQEVTAWLQGTYGAVLARVGNGTAYFDRRVSAVFTSRTLRGAMY
ncbi:phytoene desaturase [Dacryopinax primogenitus]|uniref:Phytoene desaturase n=1 Tax=Dacryopinax primogenitus (strain DJM 731) TaxID=1858805 RepID=M5FQR8_DACPD|nr:phytoene desaturase [Dacryopinax primogenitus]EJT99290.1 phytoene desaturase [Dacryopinax primogenitus]